MLGYAMKTENGRRRHVQGPEACRVCIVRPARARLHCTAEITLQIVQCATQNSSGSPQNTKHELV